MKKSHTGIFLALVLLGPMLYAAPLRVAVSDFTVYSDNPRLKYVGKGMAEMVAAELSSNKTLTLIDRNRRAELLGELEFSLSEASSDENRLRLGELLAADLLLFGDIIDMDKNILVSCTLIRVETGETIWTDKRQGTLANYSSISRALAFSVLTALGQTTKAAIRKEAQVSDEKKEEAIIAFSGAVDALDRNDLAAARREIKEAASIDPGNTAVAYYAAKLAGGSPRFQVELDRYAPTYNPAILGFTQTASVYFWFSNSGPIGSDVEGENRIVTILPDGTTLMTIKEDGGTGRLGLLLPLGPRFGLMAEVMGMVSHRAIEMDPGPVISQPGFSSSGIGLGRDEPDIGGSLGFGYLLAPGLSIGVSGEFLYLRKQPYNVTWYDIYPEAEGLHLGATLGAVYRNPSESLSADFELVWSQEPEFYLLGPESGSLKEGNEGSINKSTVPIIATLGITGGFLDQRLFANLKTICEIGVDERGYLSFRGIPGLEWWPFRWLAMRAAYEFTYVNSAQAAISREPAHSFGSGFMGGLTLVLWNFELSVNYINRYRPFRFIPGEGHKDMALLFGLSYSGFLPRN